MAAAPAQVSPATEMMRAAGDDELPTSQGKSQRNNADSVIRCWQYGRLIMDERDWTASGSELAGPVLLSNTGRHGKLRLMQFGDTFCAMKYDARGQ